MNNRNHKFHIPVMGLAYTIDSPIKVAQYGIASVISIVEDRLIEMMRSHYYPTIDLEYVPIDDTEDDYRAKRITDYLNLVNEIVQKQIEKIKTAAFEKGSEIVKYFEMLPDDSAVKKMYLQMISIGNETEKSKLETLLREQITPGSIDVNIMTKIDQNRLNENKEIIPDGSDAVTALRGYANSNLINSSIIFSAGMNPRLYNYLEQCSGFEINENGDFEKKVVIKVSDYRSALIQGKYLAKKGVWVSEFRIESGLNCGGHAFATDGYLMGPILEEFKLNKQELIDALFELYNAALVRKGKTALSNPPAMIFSAQGGIGTYSEDNFLHQYYNLDSTGWGTPFLLVPEATTVDEHTLKLLSLAKEKDIELSKNSPLGVRFHYLKGTTGEQEKFTRIDRGNPGSPCTEKLLAFNTEFTTEPICTASKKYQRLKLAELETLDLPEKEHQKQKKDILDKECLCVGLSNAAALCYETTFLKKLNAVNICPGPNITNFSKVVSLQTMTDHIYGRQNVLGEISRPHMFIAELHLYIDYLKELLGDDASHEPDVKKKKYNATFYQNMKAGMNYYRELFNVEDKKNSSFIDGLNHAEIELDSLNYQFSICEN